MKSHRFLQAAAITISSAGLVLPQSLLAAESPALPTATSPADAAAPAVLDVALTQGGLLQGKVLDTQGQPVADAPVSVRFEGKEVASTKSSVDGSFAVRGLRGGTHVVVSGEHGGICRMWTAESAPPSARSAVMIVRGGQIARGQGFVSGPGLLMAGLLGGAVAGGLISQDNSNGNGNGSGS